MESLYRNIIYQGKNLFRDKMFIFWSFIYPLIMAIFFYTAFNGIMNIEFTNVDIGISEDNPYKFIFEDIEILNIHPMSSVEAHLKLKDGEIDGFVDQELNLKVKKSGINQSIIKEILDQIIQIVESDLPMEKLNFGVNYVKNTNQRTDAIIIIFYSLIAMVSTYGVFAGIETISLMQGNLTNLGKRLNITPLKKHEFLTAGVIVSLGLNILSNIILLIFINNILKVNILTELKYSTILILVGNLFGVSLGIFIGGSSKKNANVKTIKAITITLVLSFLAGMMSPDIKIMLDESLPILGKINPISIITNNLYKINLLGNAEGVTFGIRVLIAQSILLLLISYGFIRRKTYDSI